MHESGLNPLPLDYELIITIDLCIGTVLYIF